MAVADQPVERIAEYRARLRELNAELCRADERAERRIARVLHDELGQTLAAARLMICQLRDSEVSEAKLGRLDALRERLDRSIEVTRSLAFELSPPILHELGLAPALQALGERMENDHGCRFGFTLAEGWRPPSEDAGVVLFRAVRELLHNVVKHAWAKRIRLELSGSGDCIRIVLEDDGVGFDPAFCGRAARGVGLFQVRDQMERLGGGFELESAPGRGTRARLTLPTTARVERRRRDRRRPA
jgi:signal transduction histidine kinase